MRESKEKHQFERLRRRWLPLRFDARSTRATLISDH